jgi:hypothetical protein
VKGQPEGDELGSEKGETDNRRGCPMKLLVCGGRDYTDRAALFAALDYLHARRVIELIIHGAARGADKLAAEWAGARGIQSRAFPALWHAHGKAAGCIRNQHMLDCGKPDGVVAFPGGCGTADMINRSQTAGVPVWRPYK